MLNFYTNIFMQHIVFNETVVDKTFGQQKSSCCLHPYEIYVGLLIVICTNNYKCQRFMQFLFNNLFFHLIYDNACKYDNSWLESNVVVVKMVV